jgi:hypothetical protein
MSNETEALRDMLDDARRELEMLREALNVSYEPHQSLFERMLDAAKTAKYSDWKPIDYNKLREIGEAIVHCKRRDGQIGHMSGAFAATLTDMQRVKIEDYGNSPEDIIEWRIA